MALIEWAHLPKPRKIELRKQVRQKRRTLEELLRKYIEERSPQTGTSVPVQKWPTQGIRYDLKEVFTTINDRFFSSKLSSLLRWGNGATKTSFQRTGKDASGIPWHCITIAGVYNHPDVPRFAIESIMYHEMLHIYIPPRRENGRTIMHGRDFKKMERSFSYYQQWIEWERNELPHLLTRMKRKEMRHKVKQTLLKHLLF